MIKCQSLNILNKYKKEKIVGINLEKYIYMRNPEEDLHFFIKTEIDEENKILLEYYKYLIPLSDENKIKSISRPILFCKVYKRNVKKNPVHNKFQFKIYYSRVDTDLYSYDILRNTKFETIFESNKLDKEEKVFCKFMFYAQKKI
jgi:hypothetical protein